MKNRKTIAFLLTLAMLISCFPLAASAGEIKQGKINLLSNGYYITDENDHPVIMPLFIIDEGITLRPNYSLNAREKVWYAGDVIGFWVSVSNGSVEDLELQAQRTDGSYSFRSLGCFEAIRGEWYGGLEFTSMPQGHGCYYRLRLKNTGSTTMTVDSFTGENYLP